MSASSPPAASTYAREAAARAVVIGLVLLLTAAALGLSLRREVLSGLPFITIVGALGVLALLVISRRPVAGVAMLLFGILVFESIPLPGDPTTDYASLFYINLSTWTPIKLAASPLDLLLIATLLAWFLRTGGRGRLFPPLDGAGWPLLALGACFVGGFVYGVGINGGDSRVAIYEIRAPVYLVMTYLAARATSRTARQVTLLTWLMLASVMLSTLRDVARYLFLYNGSIAGTESIAGLAHEGAIFLAAFIVFGLAQFAFGRWNGQRWLLLLGLPAMTLALLISQRRAAFVVLGAGLLIWTLALYLQRRRLFWRLIPPLLIVVACYFAVFWGRPEGVAGQPVRAVQSALGIGTVSERDLSSNEYRVIEAQDIWLTIRRGPLTGVGFGRKFDEVIPLVALTWWEYQFYTPHNQVLWIWLKTGAVGFTVMLWFFGVSIAHTLRAFRRTRHAVLGPVLLLALSYSAMLLIFAYVDIGFVNFRTMALLGLLLGIAGNAPAIEAARTARAGQLAPEGTGGK